MKKFMQKLACKLLGIRYFELQDYVSWLEEKCEAYQKQIAEQDGAIEALKCEIAENDKRTVFGTDMFIEKAKNTLLEVNKMDFSTISTKKRREMCGLYPLRFDQEEQKWFVSLNICPVQGCLFNDIGFDTEEDACKFAYILTQLGGKPKTHEICLECNCENISGW